MANSSIPTPRALATCLVLSILLSTPSPAQNAGFHDAPASAEGQKIPSVWDQPRQAAFERNCAAAMAPWGRFGECAFIGPVIRPGEAATARSSGTSPVGVNNGMPSWKSLPEEQRWEIVNYLRVLGASSRALRDGVFFRGRGCRREQRSPAEGSVYRLPIREARRRSHHLTG